jgi:hypothetical protein
LWTFLRFSTRQTPNGLCVSFWTSLEDAEEYHCQH